MRLICCLSTVSLICFVGCGSRAGTGLVPVDGNLTIDGKPAVRIAVQLVPANGKSDFVPSVGITDSSGHFTLRDSTGNRGTRTGKYKVVLSTAGEVEKDTSSLTDKQAQEERMKNYLEFQKKYFERQKNKGKDEVEKMPFPKEFAKAETSPSTVEIGKEAKTLKLDF